MNLETIASELKEINDDALVETRSKIKALYIKYKELDLAMNSFPVRSEEYQSLKKQLEEVSFSIELLEEIL